MTKTSIQAGLNAFFKNLLKVLSLKGKVSIKYMKFILGVIVESIKAACLFIFKIFGESVKFILMFIMYLYGGLFILITPIFIFLGLTNGCGKIHDKDKYSDYIGDCINSSAPNYNNVDNDIYSNTLHYNRLSNNKTKYSYNNPVKYVSSFEKGTRSTVDNIEILDNELFVKETVPKADQTTLKSDNLITIKNDSVDFNASLNDSICGDDGKLNLISYSTLTDKFANSEPSLKLADKSFTGPTGPMGLQGHVGPMGPQGLVGPRGLQGEKGEDGTLPIWEMCFSLAGVIILLYFSKLAIDSFWKKWMIKTGKTTWIQFVKE